MDLQNSAPEEKETFTRSEEIYLKFFCGFNLSFDILGLIFIAVIVFRYLLPLKIQNPSVQVFYLIASIQLSVRVFYCSYYLHVVNKYNSFYNSNAGLNLYNLADCISFVCFLFIGSLFISTMFQIAHSINKMKKQQLFVQKYTDKSHAEQQAAI